MESAPSSPAEPGTKSGFSKSAPQNPLGPPRSSSTRLTLA
jgi:hypothetical protein